MNFIIIASSLMYCYEVTYGAWGKQERIVAGCNIVKRALALLLIITKHSGMCHFHDFQTHCASVLKINTAYN